MRLLHTAETVEFEVKIAPEDSLTIEDVMLRGDDTADREAEQWVKSELARGNDCAWCMVTVIARPKDLQGKRVRLGENCYVDPPEIRGWDHLGACSYASLKDLERDLLPGMKEQALYHLNATIAWLRSELSPVVPL